MALEGRNLCRGSTFTSISSSQGTYGGYEVAKLVDGYWFGGSGQVWLATDDAAISIDIAFNGQQTFDTIEFSVGYTANLNATPHNIEIYVSDNGSDWTEVGDGYEMWTSQPSAGAKNILSITEQTALYIRIYIVDNFGHTSRTTLGEIAVYKDGTQIAYSDVDATTEQGSWPATQLGDGTDTSFGGDWRSATDSSADDIVFDFGSQKTFSSIEIVSGSGYYQYWFETYTIYGSNNGVDYTEIASGSTSALTGGVYGHIIDFTAVTYRYVKASLSDYRYSGNVFCILGEFRIFEVTAAGSTSPSVSPSLSPSASPSESPSVSPSESSSESPSVSPSASVSPSLSPSESPSESPSVSPSASISPSESPSVSPSESPSPSEGYQGYTRGDYNVLPTDDTDLESAYSAQDKIDVATKDDVRVDQTATDEFAIHQFKDYVGAVASFTLEWEGQSDLAPSASAVILQIYDHEGDVWETLDEENEASADTDFILSANISADVDHYKDENNVISCRVYQESQ